MRSYVKVYRTLDLITCTHHAFTWSPHPDVDPPPNDQEIMAMLRNAAPDQMCIYYNELVKPDGVNICANWQPFDADNNPLFGGRSGIDMANRYFPCIPYRFHPLN